MSNLSQDFKNLATNGKLSLDRVLFIINPIDEERVQTQLLLRKLEKEVGLTLGEEINTHIAKMNNTKFNLVQYHYEKPVGDQ